MAEGKPKVAEPPPSASYGRMLMISFVPLWLVLAPIGLAIWVVTLPLTLYKKLTGQPARPSPIRVTITGPEEEQCKDNVLFVHGWPDSGRLWDKQVSALSASGYRCLVVTMPNFDGQGDGSWGHNFDELREMLHDVVTKNCVRKQKVTLFLHDWGCTWGYFFMQKYPECVSRAVCLDVGGIVAMSGPMMLFVLSYQMYNVLAFLLGGYAGHFMNAAFLQVARYRCRPLSETNSSLNYPYFYFWVTMIQNRGSTRTLAGFKFDLQARPIWFGYGKRKPGMFHSNRWLAMLRNEPKCHVQEFDCDHWIQRSKCDELNAAVLQWLGQ